MKFTKFGKALLMSALSAGVVLSVTSCVQDYTVGYLYVTGTVTADSTGNGIISGYWIDHNTGKLNAIHGLPVSSGGANPVRAVLLSGSHFLYVLNRGTTASGGSNCTTADPCQNSNITVFAVGANGILTSQQTFYTQGINPFRLTSDSSGAYLFALDHDAKDNTKCALELAGATSCGDITVFRIDGTTGRLSLVTNTSVTEASGAPLTYFPVPANPVDFVLASGSVLTLNASSSAVQSYPYTGGISVFPYNYSGGQLTVSQNSANVLTDSSPSGVPVATAIVSAGSNIYVLDNNSITYTPSGSSSPITAPSQILPYTLSNGALQAQTGGAIAEDTTVSNPILLMVESKSKWIYVVNQGNNTDTNNAQSGIDAFVLTSNPFQMSTMPGAPFGTGAGPQCIVEDPSNQYIYTANANDSTVTGRLINRTSGNLTNLTTTSSYTLTGPPTWCLMDGRVN